MAEDVLQYRKTHESYERNQFSRLCGQIRSRKDVPGVTLTDTIYYMALHMLLTIEQRMIATEYFITERGESPENNKDRLASLQEAYQEMRQELGEAMGQEFPRFYDRTKHEWNRTARESLEVTDGYADSYVLPPIASNGTHAPWGERDVPWNRYRG